MLETKRLILRPFDDGDIENVFALRSDPEMMRYIREPQKRGETIEWIKLVSSLWQSDKIGLCAVCDKTSGALVGWCGLWRLKETGETEIGYAVSREFWGRGFAAEAAESCLHYGFNDLRLEKIVAVARPENTASRRVMEKIGMNYDYVGKFYERDLVHYSISRTTFLNRAVSGV